MSALQIVAVKIDHTKVAPFSNFLYFTLWDKVSKEHFACLYIFTGSLESNRGFCYNKQKSHGGQLE
jgi:hypothetical protein